MPDISFLNNIIVTVWQGCFVVAMLSLGKIGSFFICILIPQKACHNWVLLFISILIAQVHHNPSQSIFIHLPTVWWAIGGQNLPHGGQALPHISREALPYNRERQLYHLVQLSLLYRTSSAL